VTGLFLLGHRPASNAGPAHHSVSAGPSSPVVVTPSPSIALSSSASLPPGQQAATALVGLLARSGADRSSVLGAFTAAEHCFDLSRDEMVFKKAESSRRSLLGDLAALPNRSALPPAMLQDLTAAWQASSQADQDYAKWTQDAISRGCSTNSYRSDTYFQAAGPLAQRATTDKEAFATQWSSIAGQYHLPEYKANQI